MSDLLGKGIGVGLQSIFGRDKKTSPFNPTVGDISTPAFNLRTNQTSGGSSPSLTRTRSVFEGLSPEGQELFTELDVLKESVSPGFGELTESLVESVRDARSFSIGNLQRSLKDRRVAGSSFANAALTSEVLEFEKQEREARATAKIDEINLSLEINKEQTDILFEQADLDLRELEIVTGFTTDMSDILAESDQAFRELEFEKQQLEGEFFGEFGEEIAGSVGSLVTPTNVPGVSDFDARSFASIGRA